MVAVAVIEGPPITRCAGDAAVVLVAKTVDSVHGEGREKKKQ